MFFSDVNIEPRVMVDRVHIVMVWDKIRRAVEIVWIQFTSSEQAEDHWTGGLC